MTLNNLEIGHSATVTSIHNTATGRRRLLDLGILPGTQIESVKNSPLGDPVAFRVRNAVVGGADLKGLARLSNDAITEAFDEPLSKEAVLAIAGLFMKVFEH